MTWTKVLLAGAAAVAVIVIVYLLAALTYASRNDPSQLVGAATLDLAAVTLLLAAVAVFQQRLTQWQFHPQLDIQIQTAPPDCHQVPIVLRTSSGPWIVATPTGVGGQNIVQNTQTANCYYFRIRVRNRGNQRAEQVQVYAAALSREQADGSYKNVDSFLPMNLRWSHLGRPYLEAISPKMERHCDLGHIIDPNRRANFPGEDSPRLICGKDTAILSLDLEVQPTTMSHLVPPGTYRLELLVAAANAEPVRAVLELNLTGKWFDDESQMLSQGVGIRALS